MYVIITSPLGLVFKPFTALPFMLNQRIYGLLLRHKLFSRILLNKGFSSGAWKGFGFISRFGHVLRDYAKFLFVVEIYQVDIKEGGIKAPLLILTLQ